jgi:YfiH family protein
MTRGNGRPGSAHPGLGTGGARWVSRGDLRILTWEAFAPAADVAVTTTQGGVSAGPYATLNLSLAVGDQPERVLENRRRAAGALGAGLDDLVLANQVHGGRAVVVNDTDRGRGARDAADTVADADALVTTGPGPVLVVLTADCVPMVLCDPAAGVLAVVHAGWRGTVAHVGPAAVETMVGLGADPRRMVVGIGPAVFHGRYQVGPEVAGAADASFGAAGAIRPDGHGRWLLDLPAANTYLLERCGVPAGQIHRCTLATGEPGHFFSDRDVRPCGRFGLLARLRG